MNRTAYALALTDDELTQELDMYHAEMMEHISDLSAWRGYEMYLLLVGESQDRAEQASRAELTERLAA
jgi:hypothetical protein